MPGIPLRAYENQINQWLEAGENTRAIQHCLHILAQYPKRVDTYRLLGSAFLGKLRYKDAADIFLRLLSAVPDDRIAHIGMSVIYEESNDLDRALWHMARVYELQPANRVFQDELRRLYGRRDGVEPARLQLTRGALARLYYRGNLNIQAIAEIRVALVEDPRRLDLQVLQAQILAESGMRHEAIEISHDLLDKLPYCLVANRILAEQLPGSENAQKAHIHRMRVIELDPYYAKLPVSGGSTEKILDEAILIEPLASDDIDESAWRLIPGSQVEQGITTSQRTMIDEEGIPPEFPDNVETMPATDQNIPNWLEGLEGEIPAQQIQPTDGATVPEHPMETGTDDSVEDQADDILPDFLGDHRDPTKPLDL